MEAASAGLLSEWCAVLCTYLCVLPGEAAPAPLLRTTVSGFPRRSNPVRASQTSACSHQGIKRGWVCALSSHWATATDLLAGGVNSCRNVTFITMETSITAGNNITARFLFPAWNRHTQFLQIKQWKYAVALMAESAIDIGVETTFRCRLILKCKEAAKINPCIFA